VNVVLFVEGSNDLRLNGRNGDSLTRLWNDHLCGAAGIQPFSAVYGISKQQLVGMNPRAAGLSGMAPGFDVELARRLSADQSVEAAVVAWDLHPKWNPTGTYCRWSETLMLYRGLAASTALPSEWAAAAQIRLNELSARGLPSDRPSPPSLERNTVLPLCMEHMFESLLASSEAAVRRALGVDGLTVKDWPSWRVHEHDPARRLVEPAIECLFRMRPKPRLVSHVGGGFVTHKNDWNELIVREVLSGPDSARIVDHPFIKRLGEIGARR